MTAEPPDPVLPDYGDRCLNNVVPSLLGTREASLLPEVDGAAQIVLLVLDGLGWEQFQAHRSQAPNLAAFEGDWITSVAPSTTATALSSIATGSTPGQHGVVGYRFAVEDEVMNVLRWATEPGDARRRIIPEEFQLEECFEGERPPVVSRAEFLTSGFTRAHLNGVRFAGYRTLGTLITNVDRLVRDGEPFVYAYYDGIDKVAHEYGVDSPHYRTEIRMVDHLVSELLMSLRPGSALVVTSDHGQVDVGPNILEPSPELLSNVERQSGEGRFRWLHAHKGGKGALLDAARAEFGHVAWVHTVEELIDRQWFGPTVSDAALSRLGDVALVTYAPVAINEPNDTGPFQLVARHGSLTSAEMLVPLLYTSL